MRNLGEEQRKLKASCANMLVTSTMVHWDIDNQTRARMLTKVLSPLEAWQQDSNKTLREVFASRPWLLSQMGGEGCRMLQQTLDELGDRSTMRYIGFTDGEWVASLRDNNAADKVVQDDELAAHMGSLALGIVKEFYSRQLWYLRGWPAGLLLIFEGNSQAEVAIKLFRSDYERFLHLEDRVRAGEPLDDMLARSCFQTLPVQQVLRHLETSQWRVTPALEAFLAQKYRCFLQSQLAEDAFNTLRRLETSSLNKQTRAPALFAALTRDRLLEMRHNFLEVNPPEFEKPFGKGHATLPKDMFKASVAQNDPPIRDCQGFASKTPWYTCSPNAYGTQFSDLSLLQEFRALEGHDSWSDVQHAWLGCLFNSPILVKRTDDEGEHDDSWYFTVGDTPGSACLLIPAEERYLGDDADASYFVPKVGSTMRSVAVTNPAKWVARSYKWRSPAWQCVNFPHLRCYTKAIFEGVRAFPDSSPIPLLKLCARNAFFSVPVVLMRKIANHLQVPGITASSSLFETTWCLCSHILGRQPEDILPTVAQRMATMMVRQAPCAVECLGMDEGMQLLDRDEEKAMRDAQKDIKVEQNNVQTFALELMAKKKEITAAATKRRRKAPGLRLPESTISQAEARVFVPEGAHIWRNLRDGGWAGHYPPYRRVSALWSIHGERGSMLVVLRALWRQFLQHAGRPESECTVEGLLSLASASGAASSQA